MAWRMSRHMHSVNYAIQLTCCMVTCRSDIFLTDCHKELPELGCISFAIGCEK